MRGKKNAAARGGLRRRDWILHYVRGSLVMIGSFAGVAVVLALIT